MNKKRKWISYLWALFKKALMVCVTMFCLYLLSAVILSIWSTNPEISQCQNKREFFVSSNGVHLYLVLHQKYLPDHLSNALSITATRPFVAIGWGDRGFYLHTPEWKDLKIGIAFKALFLPSSSALHITRYQNQHPSWLSVQVCEPQFQKLMKFIQQGFAWDERKEVIPIDHPGYTAYDTFYEGNGCYTMFYTSNNWVNEALKMAEVKTSIWSPLDKGVLYHLKK